jgi:hypothetical protein
MTGLCHGLPKSLQADTRRMLHINPTLSLLSHPFRSSLFSNPVTGRSTFRAPQEGLYHALALNYGESTPIYWSAYPLLGNDLVNTSPYQQRLCFPWGPCKVVVGGDEMGSLKSETVKYGR